MSLPSGSWARLWGTLLARALHVCLPRMLRRAGLAGSQEVTATTYDVGTCLLAAAVAPRDSPWSATAVVGAVAAGGEARRQHLVPTLSVAAGEELLWRGPRARGLGVVAARVVGFALVHGCPGSPQFRYHLVTGACLEAVRHAAGLSAAVLCHTGHNLAVERMSQRRLVQRRPRPSGPASQAWAMTA